MSILKKVWILSTLLLVLCLSTNAIGQKGIPKLSATSGQYRLLSKGEPMPYTGVALSLPTYRAVRAKTETQSKLIAEQRVHISQMALDTVIYSQRLAVANEKVAEERIMKEAAQSHADVLSTSLVYVQEQLEKSRPKWYQKPLPLLGGGFVLGSAATIYGIIKLSK